MYFIYKGKKLFWGQRDGTMGRVLALDVADPVSIPGSPFGAPTLPGVTLSAGLEVTPEHLKCNPKIK